MRLKTLALAAALSCAAVQAADSELMSAALHGKVADMKRLLERGADPNAANEAGATALMWSVHDPAKVKLLLDHGAAADARSKEGWSALMTASRQPGSAAVVRMLLAKGADAKVRDPFGGTPLMLAAEVGDVEVMRLLVERGADVNAHATPAFGIPRFGRTPIDQLAKAPAPGLTPLMFAAWGGNTEAVRFLLEKGADVRVRTLFGTDALTYAVQYRDPEIARVLLARGATADGRSRLKATPLIFAAASDEVSPATIDLLLKHGADPAAVDAEGSTALTWASKRGATPVSKRLGYQGPAPGSATLPAIRPDITEAVERSIALLQASSAEFVKKSGCISCHNQSIPAMAIAAARAGGFRIDQAAATRQLKATLAVLAPAREALLQSVPVVPETGIVSTYSMLGMAAEGQAANDLTDAMVHELASRQRPDGRWRSTGTRPPLDQGDITTTALALRSMQLYPIRGREKELAARVAKARAWLLTATAETNQEKVMRLLGLTWSKAEPKAVRAASATLLAAQRADGGWAQLDTLESDAYATGQALVALKESGALRVADPAYRRGADYLLGTQLADGSWHVKTRTMGFQAYFESGFPHGHDQWISAAGTGWAAMALAYIGKPVEISRR